MEDRERRREDTRKANIRRARYLAENFNDWPMDSSRPRLQLQHDRRAAGQRRRERTGCSKLGFASDKLKMFKQAMGVSKAD